MKREQKEPKKEEKNKEWFKRWKIVGVCILLLVSMSGVYLGTNTQQNTTETAIPKCILADELTNQRWVLYGRVGCPYCDQQKEHFGDCVNNISYVDCSLLYAENPDLFNQSVCPQLQGVPAWVKDTGMVEDGQYIVEVRYGLRNETFLWEMLEVE